MILRPPQEVPFEQLAAGEGVTAERIVDFPDFEVRRLRLDAGSTEDFLCAERYALVMVVEGQLRLGHLLLGAEQAAYLPPAVPVALASSQPPAPLVLLLALPRS
jgi:mannose-6-phosphate isomerase class I